MRYTLTFVFFFVSLAAFAQKDSIKNEILNYQNNETEIISKARRMLIDKLMIDDYQKMKEIKDYLKNDIENQNYLTLYLPEYWLILYWTQEFDELLSSIEQVGYSEEAKKLSTIDEQIRPSNDKLFENLREKSRNSKHLLDIIIENAPVNQEEKDFLNLHLSYCLSDYSNYSNDQDSLNTQADKFLLKYPSSTYGPFVKKVIRYKEKVSDFGWGYDISLGYGGFSGGISETFSDYFVFGMSFEFVYSDFVLNVGFSLGGSKLKKDIDYKTVIWEKEKKSDIIVPQASIGYTFFNKRRISITPLIGISSMYISPKWDDMRSNTLLEDVELVSNASWNAGISLNLYSKPSIPPRYVHRMNQIQGFVKLKYNYYYSGYDKGYYGLDGAMHQVTIAFGGFSRKVRRSW